MNKRLISFMFVFFVLVLAAACSNNNNASEGQQNVGNNGSENIEDPRADWPDKLVIGRVPSEDETDMNRNFEPFKEYLEERLGLETEVFIGTNYTAVIEAMRNGHVDIGQFGAFSYVLANSRANAQSFATSLSAPDAEGVYYSLFITLEDSGIHSLADLENRSFVFADSASTSGYLFPRAHLINELGLDNSTVDNYFSSVAIAGPQEAVFLSVLNGDAEAGTLADITLSGYLEKFSDHPNVSKIKTFETTNAIPRGATSYRSELPESLKEAIREAYFDMINVPELAEYRENENLGGGYVPSDDSEYEVIRTTAKALDLNLEEME